MFPNIYVYVCMMPFRQKWNKEERKLKQRWWRRLQWQDKDRKRKGLWPKLGKTAKLKKRPLKLNTFVKQVESHRPLISVVGGNDE